MSSDWVTGRVRRILGPGNLYSPGCKEWFWLREDGFTVYLGVTLWDVYDTLKKIERQADSDEAILERLLALEANDARRTV